MYRLPVFPTNYTSSAPMLFSISFISVFVTTKTVVMKK